MLPTPIRYALVAAAVLAAAGCSTNTATATTAGPMPAPLAEYQYFDGEAGFLRAVNDVQTPRSDADLVRLAQASCRAIMEQGASRTDLRPAITDWAAVDDTAADAILTAASGNLCESAILLDR